MAHNNYQSMMSLALDKQLGPEDESRLMGHLSDCDACGAIWEAMSGLDALFGQMPMVAPQAGFTTRVMARVEAHRVRRRWPETFFWLTLMVLMGGVMLSQWVPSLAPLAAGLAPMPVPTPLMPFLESLRSAGTVLLTLIDALALWLSYVVSLPLAWVVGITTLALAATWVGLIGVFGPGQSVPATRDVVWTT